MPLSLFKQSDTVEVSNIMGGKKVKKFLENLGFVQGEKVQIVSNTDGDMIVKIKESKVAVGKDISTKIIVKPV